MKNKTQSKENLKGVCIAILSPKGKTANNLTDALMKAGCKVVCADDLEKLLKITSKAPAKALLLDLSFCEAYYQKFANNDPELENAGSEIIIVAAEGKSEEAFAWAKKVSGYFITTPTSAEEITILLERAMDSQLLKKRLARYESPDSSMERFGPIIVKSPEMKDVVRLANILSTREDSILFVGAIGTGKELLAKTIHENSARRHGPFYSINCRSFSSEDLAVELFGRGEPTNGETEEEQTLLDMCESGTLLLDEIGVISPNVQGKLQRFLEDNTFTRVNSRTVCKADVRIFASTSVPLDEAVAKGEFSEDLYFRLNRFTLHIPPLRRRVEDIPVLTKTILLTMSQERGEEGMKITEEALKLLMEYHWPGNIRELENCLEFSALVSGGNPIEPKHLPKQFHDEVGSIFIGASVDELPTIDEIERRYILRVMDATRGNKVKAAQILDINRATLHRKLQMYDQQKVANL
ncbi:MAG: sigma-54 dependent transcriptional regulator [Candidatus Omnitrophota bacterium]